MPQLSLWLALTVLSLASVLVHFRLDHLGTMTNAVIVWLITVTANGRARDGAGLLVE